MVKDTELYNRLELKPDASDTEIKKAFLRLSKIWHPDKHQEQKEEASKKFQDIQQAKETLLDTEKRRMYDQIGMDIFSQPQHGPPEDHPFASMFGGGFPFGMPGMPGMGRRQERQPDPLVETLNITLEDVYNQRTVPLTYTYQALCKPCSGEGTKDGKPSMCGGCNGQGRRVHVVQMGPMVQQSISECPNCRGTGLIVTDQNRCDTCKGHGTFNQSKTRLIPLKAGLDTGNKIYMPQKGHHLKNGQRSDLIVMIQVMPHEKFKRRNEDLIITLELGLYQALCGYDKKLTHLDGRVFHLHHDGPTSSHTVRCLPTEGMHKLDQLSKGSLYVIFTIRLPALPPSAINEWKKALQRLDEQEVKLEKEITQHNNAQFTTLLPVMDSTAVLSVMYFKNQEPHREHEQHQQHERMPPQPGCAHQ